MGSDAPSETGCSDWLKTASSIATILALVIAVLAWVAPFNEIGPFPWPFKQTSEPKLTETPMITAQSTDLPPMATRTLLPVPTATPVLASPVPTAMPTSADTSTPCPAADTLFLSQWSAVQDKLGCAEGHHLVTWLGEEQFEGGWMYWRKDTDMIYVVYQGEIWEQYANIWQEGDPLYSCPDQDTPSESPPTPFMGFGKIWCSYPLVRQNLGWALEEGGGFDAPLQGFEHGLLLQARDWTWVLYDDGTWERQ